MQDRKKWMVWLTCVMTALVGLTLVSKCSFLYPFNDWVDANIFFTMGKSMMNGRVLYRDIYDHKGPLLYFLHGIAYLISNRSFLGVYLLEVMTWTVFLYGAYQIIALYVENPELWWIPVFGALILSSPSFCHGDSAEEFTLPLQIFGLYTILKYFQQAYPKPIENRTVFMCGILAGVILNIKFTLLGLFFAWTIVLMLICFVQKEWKQGVITGVLMLLGMLTATLPWVIYFGWHGALKDWWTGYIYNNLFLYTGQGNGIFRMVKDILKNTIDTFIENAQYSVFTILGVLWYGIFSRKQSRAAKAALWFLCVMTTVGICIGVKQWQPYYGLLLSVFSCLGVGALMEWISNNKRVQDILHSGMSGAVSLVLAFGILLSVGNYTDQLMIPKEELVQYRFAEKMQVDDETTLMNYGFLDGGFYTVAGIVPDCKYFAKLNLGLAEMYEAQEQYVAEGRGDYVITREFELDEKYMDQYVLIDSMKQDYEGILYTYYLYQKNER